jgi:ketosteroid isomerase-like protein
MKKLFLILPLSLILISCETKQPGFTQEEVETAVLEIERQALGYWSAGNPTEFPGNFANDASYFDDIAAHTRLDGIEEIQNHFTSLEGAIPPHNYEIVDQRVQSFGNIAILTFRYHSTIDGQSGPPWKATSVYHYDNENWKVVHANWSLVKEQ